MAEYVFGANILENLTTGMYQDSKVIYREYIQNSCDQIDRAEQLGILRSRDLTNKYPDLGQGIVDIWLYPENRYISIEDNATGIKADEFQRVLGNIADSDKVMGKDKGFRGIGRLCGLAYCKQLVFTSRWIGEDVVSIMTCDALKMREMINEANTKIQKHTALDVLNAMVDFGVRPAQESDPAHFFKVELININEENEELFGGRDDDNIEQLTNYLSFVAPVPYTANFIYRSEIYEHAKKLSERIDEYDIRINGEQILKKYKTHLKTGNGQDNIFGVEFYAFYAGDNSLLAWMWFGKTTFKAAIKEEENSRGLRLRKDNIQIGEDDALRDMFSRDKRGNNYFIGEIFAIDQQLIPNSQRAYFNENPVRLEFERKLKDYFNNTLYNIFYDGSEINASIRKINSYTEKASEFEKKVADGGFLSDEEREREQTELAKKKAEAKIAQSKLEKKKISGRSPLAPQIMSRRSNDVNTVLPESDSKPKLTSSVDKKEEEPLIEPSEASPYRGRKKFLADMMFPGYNKNERKLLSETLEKIFSIIEETTDKKTSENIIKRIKEDLK